MSENTETKYKNEYILQRRRKLRIKRAIMLSIILISVLTTLCLKLSYFNILNIYVHQNKTISDDEIVKQSGITKGTNIFYFNERKAIANILDNPYVLETKIKRRFPDTIDIYIKERNAVFFVEKNKKYLIVDQNGIVLEEKDNIQSMNLIKLSGFDVTKASVGKAITGKDDKRLDTIGKITELAMADQSNLHMSAVDLSDSSNSMVYFGNMCVKLGNSDKLQEKLNKAINILSINNYKDGNGYIDVSFNGNPVVSIQK
ncbi:MAG: FtsQ-type POTRA domain-containing protein [Bacillota bacterium]|nr:FtsQ-type POTRA domain-containing protein [Bacillota bacterium]